MKSPRPNFSLYPLAWLAVSFAVGIFASSLIKIPTAISLTFCGASALAAFAMIRGKRVEVFLLAAFFLAGSFVHTAAIAVPDDRIKTIYDNAAVESGEPVEIEGVLTQNPEPSFDGYFLRMRVERLVHDGAEKIVSGDVKLFAPIIDDQIAAEYAEMHLQYGTQIRVACNLEREESFQNPGVMSRKTILDQQGVDATANIKSPLLIEVIGHKPVFVLLAWIFDKREQLILDIKQNFDRPTSGVLIASLLGDRYFLDKHTADVFREGGTFHVLVISGLHITFIGGLTLFVLQMFTRRRFWHFVIASGFLWGYTFAVGADVPVVRATVMFTILAFSQVINRRGTLLNSFGLCALILLAWRPEDLFSASFQLTFVSVGSIVVMAFPLIEKLRAIGKWTPGKNHPFPPAVPAWLRKMCEALYWREEVWEIEGKRHVWSARLFKSPTPHWPSSADLRSIIAYAFEAIIVSMIVQVSLLPLLVIYFHRISLASVLLNLWVGFLIALESFMAIFAVALSHTSAVAAWPFSRLTEILNWLLVAIPGTFAEGGWASFRLPAYTGPGKIVYFLYAIPIIFFAWVVFRWDPFDHKNHGREWSGPLLRVAAVSFCALAAIVIFHPFSASRADGKLHVKFLDVGQGDSALIVFPNGETMLVDGGGQRSFRRSESEDSDEASFEPDRQQIGEAVVSAFLWDKGYSKIDYILATHADADHIEGLTDVARNFEVRHAFFGQLPANDPDFAELAYVLSKRKISSSVLSAGDEMEIGGVRVEVLYPEPDETPNDVSDNDHSVVLRLVFGERKVLLTGDIERKAENALLANPGLLSADIVKVPHHGSRTSSAQSFVDAVKPSLAVISVGKHSIFGHPNAEVVERWQLAGAKTLTTGERGTISISTDGRDLQIAVFRNSE